MKVDGLFCPNDALIYQRKASNFCAEHSVVTRQAAFIEKSKELARELGQPESLKPAPFETYEHRPFEVGVLDRTEVASDSRPGVMYPMAKMVGRGWVHLTSDCMGWTERGTCKHVDRLNGKL